MWGLPKDGEEEEKVDDVKAGVMQNADDIDVDKLVEDQWDNQ